MQTREKSLTRSNAIHQLAEQALQLYLIYQNGVDNVKLQENKEILQKEADYWMAIYLKKTGRKRTIFKELGF